jgi:GH25 family lysozyme M1 (1,4-beta-N-acetylmuramidase)
MARGIDIYGRYQTVTNWQAVKDSGVTFAYVKATDGSGYATVRADGMVNGAHGVGIPVGLYHFSQPGNATTQANLLLGEVCRLNATGMGPALDLEDNPPGSGKANIPDSQKAAYAVPFLRTVAAAGFRPVAYMNSALAKLLRPDRWDVPGLVLWIASYGANDGSRHPLTGGYPGRTDIHQYTSVGRVPGITGSVDMNESLTDISNKTEDDVAFTDQIKVAAPSNRSYVEQHEAAQVIGDTYFWAADTYQAVNNVLVPAVAALGAAVSGGTFDQAAFQAHLDVTLKKAIDTAVVPIVQQALRDAGADEYAEAVVDLLQKRLGSGTQQPTA